MLKTNCKLSLLFLLLLCCGGLKVGAQNLLSDFVDVSPKTEQSPEPLRPG
jgi:hypothetical protein